MPKIISTAQEITYLRALAETGNATLAAERAGVSRTWAYKKRAGDAWFAEKFREFTALAPLRRRLRRRSGHASCLCVKSLPSPGSITARTRARIGSLHSLRFAPVLSCDASAQRG
jgi:hypothetical protein